jgi:predicted molibdopterin-dependent oxidoreductase YjgC
MLQLRDKILVCKLDHGGERAKVALSKSGFLWIVVLNQGACILLARGPGRDEVLVTVEEGLSAHVQIHAHGSRVFVTDSKEIGEESCVTEMTVYNEDPSDLTYEKVKLGHQGNITSIQSDSTGTGMKMITTSEDWTFKVWELEGLSLVFESHTF